MQFPGVQFLAAAAANYQQIFVSPHAAVLGRDNESLFLRETDCNSGRGSLLWSCGTQPGATETPGKGVCFSGGRGHSVFSKTSRGHVLSGTCCPRGAPAAVNESCQQFGTKRCDCKDPAWSVHTCLRGQSTRQLPAHFQESAGCCQVILLVLLGVVIFSQD